MKITPIVAQLANLLPFFSSDFNSEIPVTLARVGSVVTATAGSPHGLLAGSPVTIVGADTPITAAFFTRAGTVGTITTSTDHDRTLPQFIDRTDLSKVVKVSGANPAEFNGTFELIGVPNRRTLLVRMPNSGGTAADAGTPKLAECASAAQQYNGTRVIATVPTPTTFTFSFSTTAENPTGSPISAKGPTRVAAATTVDRMKEIYTRHAGGQAFAFVMLGDVQASKDRLAEMDFTANIGQSQHFKQTINQPVIVYVFIPASIEIAGRQARDAAEDIFVALCRSLLHTRFDTGLHGGTQGSMMFVSHRVAQYDAGAVYVHEYNFESIADLVWEDTVGPARDVAFRDVDLTAYPGIGQDAVARGEIDVVTSLDEEPL